MPASGALTRPFSPSPLVGEGDRNHRGVDTPRSPAGNRWRTAAVLGDAVNYAIGYRVGPRVFKYERSRLLNRKHLLRAQAFYEKYGNKTIILARFVPIVRTFAPFVAGIGTMRYQRFALYNVVGAVAWVLICLFGGYFFGQ